MATFVLVPGAWLGAWAWRKVEAELRDAGHDVHAMTLTGLGDRAHLADGVTLSTHIDDVVATIEAEELTDVVLVGHSYAGMVVGGVANRIPERVAHVVYLAASLPVDGKSLFDTAGEGFRGYLEAQNPDGRWPFLGDEELAQFYPDNGLGADDLAWIRRHAATHPLATFAEPSGASNPAAAALPKTFVQCAKDEPVELPGDRSTWGYAELATGHWPMVTLPAELAGLLATTAKA